MAKGRKLLSMGTGIVITMSSVGAAATGNLMAPPHREEKPAKKTPDAGTPAPAPGEKKAEEKK